MIFKLFISSRNDPLIAIKKKSTRFTFLLEINVKKGG